MDWNKMKVGTRIAFEKPIVWELLNAQGMADHGDGEIWGWKSYYDDADDLPEAAVFGMVLTEKRQTVKLSGRGQTSDRQVRGRLLNFCGEEVNLDRLRIGKVSDWMEDTVLFGPWEVKQAELEMLAEGKRKRNAMEERVSNVNQLLLAQVVRLGITRVQDSFRIHYSNGDEIEQYEQMAKYLATVTAYDWKEANERPALIGVIGMNPNDGDDELA